MSALPAVYLENLDGTVIGSAGKSSGDVVRLGMDFGDDPRLIALLTNADGSFNPSAVAIVTYSITTTGSGAPTITNKQIDFSYQISALVSGGTGGGLQYQITYSITLSDPDATTIVRTATLTIQ